MKIWPFGNNAAPVEHDEKLAPLYEEKASTTFDHSSLFMTGQEISFGTSGTDSAYQNSWIAYACIRRLAQDASGVPLLFLSDPKNIESEVPPTHPTRLLFENPGMGYSTSELLQWLVTWLNMRGEMFIAFDDANAPKIMIPMTDPKHWKEVSVGHTLAGWEYQNAGVHQVRTPSELIHHRLINPTQPFRGQSPLQAAAVAYNIETGANSLTQNVINRGGEKSMIFTSEKDITRQQRDQAIAMLRGRRTGGARISRDTLLPNGVKPLDPKFIDDDDKILAAGALQPDKIAAVYGVPRSLLGYEDVDKFATFEGRKRMYYTDTLVPMLSGISDAFDRFFVHTLSSAYKCYVRFDWSAVAAMQDNLNERFELAAKAHAAGLPWSVLNQRFSLGLDVDNIPGGDTIMISSTLAPVDKIIEEWNSPAATSANPPGKSDGPRGGGSGEPAAAPLTNALIRKRATNARSTVQRGLRTLRQEKAFRKEWKAELTGRMNKATKAIAGVTDPKKAKAALASTFKNLGPALAGIATGFHQTAAREGQQSIVELVEGKMSNEEMTMYRKQIEWAPGVSTFIRERHNFIVGKYGQEIFADVLLATEEALLAGKDTVHVQHVIRDRFRSAPGGINRATTIAATEIGTAYGVARFSEMKVQKFESHQWLTVGDELVRQPPEADFNHAICHEETVQIDKQFTCGLTYPQEDGGEPGNVINCRCITIPVLKDEN